MPTLYIIRGLPGSGKSTFAQSLVLANLIMHYWEADDFMKNTDGQYQFDPTRLGECHSKCKHEVRIDMEAGLNVAVSNTSTTEKELKPYLDMAKEYGYTVVSLIVENRHGNESTHGVPDESMRAMRNRFSISL